MEALRITARMAEPVVSYGDGMHLDGILAWAAYMDLPREEREELPNIQHTDAPADFDLPLERWEHCGHWGWCASAVHADWSRRGIHNVRRRTPLAEMQRYTPDGSVNVKGGRYKPSDIPMPTIFARQLVWYALGDLSQIGRLLDRVSNLGKLSNVGAGRVLHWIVERQQDDWSVHRDDDLTRRMPTGVPWTGLPCYGGLRPPYWHRSRQAEAVEPLFEELRC